jgi:hypothetical protein
MALRLGVDLDGVVADFRSAFEGAAIDTGVTLPAGAVNQPPEELTSRQIKRIWEHVQRSPNWWTRLRAYEPQEIARIYELSRERQWEVVFLTRRPSTAGDSVQRQSQWWLEQQGFYYPAVVTVPGSRGELANALRLDIVMDDQLHNCVDVISASTAKALLLSRHPADGATRDHASDRGIGVVSCLKDAVEVIMKLEEMLKERRGRLQRLADWFSAPSRKDTELPARPPRPGLVGNE